MRRVRVEGDGGAGGEGDRVGTFLGRGRTGVGGKRKAEVVITISENWT